MHSKSDTIIILLVLLSFFPGAPLLADSQKSVTKKSTLDVLKGCSEREKRTSQALSDLMDQLDSATKSDDLAKMKKALSDTKLALSKMKSDHEKSAEVMTKLHKHLQDLKNQIKVSKQEHDKAADLVEDEDMDDVIWAY